MTFFKAYTVLSIVLGSTKFEIALETIIKVIDAKNSNFLIVLS